MRAFYLDHRESDETQIIDPIDAAEALRVAERVLDCHDRNFFGLVNGDDDCIQFAPQADGLILVDMPIPERHGSWQRRITMLHVAELFQNITDDLIAHLFRLWRAGEQPLPGFTWAPFPQAAWSDLVARDRRPS